ncbi:E3 ubiquitin-protein ligase RGLG5-like isoform X2 [Wolffia australiana]
MGGNQSSDLRGKNPRLPISRKRSSKRESSRTISDNYATIHEVKAALQEGGLESSNLIIAVDFTKSNEWTGENSFEGKNLHDLDHPSMNPYEQVISIIGQTLSGFDEDNLIPCYGFGDDREGEMRFMSYVGYLSSSASSSESLVIPCYCDCLSIIITTADFPLHQTLSVTTHDEAVFSFLPNDQPCNGFEDVLRVYREITPFVQLSGPTSFSPAIETAMDIVDRSGGRYHVLVIVADGQITRSADLPSGKFSVQERRTIQALVKASEYPLSIICVGVGDGPWDTMAMFDDYVPERTFDNFQFVEFSRIMNETTSQRKEASFALAALMEIPEQYKAILRLDLLGQTKGVTYSKEPRPPPNNN